MDRVNLMLTRTGPNGEPLLVLMNEWSADGATSLPAEPTPVTCDERKFADVCAELRAGRSVLSLGGVHLSQSLSGLTAHARGCLRGGKVRLHLGETCTVLGVIDDYDGVAFPHMLVLIAVDPRDIASDFGQDGDEVSVDLCVIGRLV